MEQNIEKYLTAFEKRKQGAEHEPAWLRGLREEAMESFSRTGFPTQKNEAWRYTPVTPLIETALAVQDEEPSLSQEILAALKEKPGRTVLVTINGKFQPEHSSIPSGVEVMDLAQAIAAKPDLVAAHLGQHADPGHDAFSALNACFFKKGLFIRIPENFVLSEPLHITNLTQASHQGRSFHARNLVVLEKKSKAAIVETYRSTGGESYFTNAVTEIVLGEGSALEHCKIQREHPEAFHVAVTQVTQRRASSFVSFVLSTGARLMRNTCRVALAEEGASCVLNGLYLGDKDQLLDHQTFVDHQKPDGKSDQFFKGLMAGNSRGVFRGQIMVRQDAQRTDAHQTNKNLLLSDTAKVDTQPQLEILADDVKCSHGAAIGQLQEDAFFYLRSRGIGEKEAAHLLAQGFAREVIERSASQYLKELLLELVNEKLTEQLGNAGA
jgi:Fe-S cluster assembly protein SufD